MLNKNLYISTRIEEDENKVLSRERKATIAKKELVVNKGFTGSTLGRFHSEGMENYLGGSFDIITHFFNPLQISLHYLLFLEDEKRMPIFSTGTEIKYQYVGET